MSDRTPIPTDPSLPDVPETDQPPREDVPEQARENLEKTPAPPDPIPDPGPL
ncbi:hypothetical protein [Stutzerimonas azotifigens]|uniref:hypothetical protein n=1 Tax=Stutzerimonas azotifigens TaxID=291995 RepID=UPI00040F86F9|nr:hypothetical protein [Stutzerimonas azotifigens]